MRTQNYNGFTLVELLVTIAVFAILAGIAMPSFTSLIAGQKIRTSVSMLQSSLMTARSEALKRSTNVTVSPIGGLWSSGWTTVVSSTGENLFNLNNTTSATISGPASIVYNNAGRVAVNSGATFKFSSPETGDFRCLTVDLSGLPMVFSTGC